MAKQRTVSPLPPADFGDLAAAFANPTKAVARPSAVEPAAASPASVSRAASGNNERTAQQDDLLPVEKRGRGRPRAPEPLVNQTLSLRVDQLQRLHQIAAAEYGRLGRRVLPSEVVRVLLDRALAEIGDRNEGVVA